MGEPSWYKKHEKAVKYFFSDHLFLLDSDEDDDFVYSRPIDKILALFEEYGAEGLIYKD